jgi:CDP-glucose 4,6-dehydratase
MSLWLQGMGATLFGFSISVPTKPSLFEAAKIEEGMTSTYGDIRDRSALLRDVRRFEPEIIIHMAAQPTVLRGYAEPLETFETNVIGTVNVLDVLRTMEGIRAALVVTSDKCYRQNSSAVSFQEDDPLGGNDPYSSSKACAEIATAAYRASFFRGLSGSTAIATARAGNVIGGGDWAADRIVPDLVRSFQAGSRAQVRNPNHVRPWQHVLDPVGGYLQLVQRLYRDGANFAQAWNFGPAPESGISVGDLASRVAAHWGDNAQWETTSRANRPEASQLRLDSGKARDELGWSPRLDLDTSVHWTVEWYKEVAGGRSARDATVDQIERYVG